MPLQSLENYTGAAICGQLYNEQYDRLLTDILPLSDHGRLTGNRKEPDYFLFADKPLVIRVPPVADPRHRTVAQQMQILRRPDRGVKRPQTMEKWTFRSICKQLAMKCVSREKIQVPTPGKPRRRGASSEIDIGGWERRSLTSRTWMQKSGGAFGILESVRTTRRDFTAGLLCALCFGQTKYRRPDPVDSIFYFDINYSEAYRHSQNGPFWPLFCLKLCSV